MSPVSWGSSQGHSAVYIDNDLLRATVLPGKGADVYELVHLPTGVDCLMKTPSGLQPPGPGPQLAFLDNYEGGWQELFPSGNDACVYRARPVPFHGEAALLPWETEVLSAGESPCVRFTTQSRIFPFRLSKTLRMRPGSPVLEVAQSVENIGTESFHYTWGQHIVLGASFLEAGCRLEVPATTILTGEVILEPATAVLAPGQCEPWPYAAAREPGRRVDLRHIPGREAHTHDDVFLAGLSAGHCTVTNPRLNLTVSLDWDAAFYRYLALWLPYGGCESPPLTGIYGLGIEPFVSRDNLAGAVAGGEARLLDPGQVEQTTLNMTFQLSSGVELA